MARPSAFRPPTVNSPCFEPAPPERGRSRLQRRRAVAAHPGAARRVLPRPTLSVGRDRRERRLDRRDRGRGRGVREGPSGLSPRRLAAQPGQGVRRAQGDAGSSRATSSCSATPISPPRRRRPRSCSSTSGRARTSPSVAVRSPTASWSGTSRSTASCSGAASTRRSRLARRPGHRRHPVRVQDVHPQGGPGRVPPMHASTGSRSTSRRC